MPKKRAIVRHSAVKAENIRKMHVRSGDSDDWENRVVNMYKPFEKESLVYKVK